MENSDSESSVDHNSFASVINLYEQRPVSTVSAAITHGGVQNISCSSNCGFEEICVHRKGNCQDANNLYFSSHDCNSAVLDVTCAQGSEWVPANPNKISKSVQTSFKLKKNISSSHNLSTEKDIYANSLKLSPMDTLTHLHIPQYRPLPAHKLGIISEDLSSAFPVLDFTFQQKYRDQHQQQHQSVSASAAVSSSGTGSTAVTVYTTTVISPSVINTSLTNYESQQTNIYDNSLTHSYDKSSIRLMLSENTNQNYPIVYYNQKVCDYNKYFPEQSIALTDRSIVSKQDQSSTAKFSYPGGDSGISNTSPDTYSLSEPGLVASTSQFPLDNNDNYNHGKVNVSSQTISHYALDYATIPKRSNNDNNNYKSRHKLHPYPFIYNNQRLFNVKTNTSKNVCIPSTSTNYSSYIKRKRSYDKKLHKIWQTYENRLYKFNEITSSSSLSSASESSLTSSSSSSSTPSSSTPTNSSTSELFTVKMSRAAKNQSTDDDDEEETSSQQAVTKKETLQNTQSNITGIHSISKKENEKKSNTSILASVRRSKSAKYLIKMIYGILLTILGFLLVCAKVSGDTSVSLVLEGLINFLLLGQLMYLMTFYISNYCKACRSFCDCCLVKSSRHNVHRFHYGQNYTTNLLLRRGLNQRVIFNRAEHHRPHRVIHQSDVKQDSTTLTCSKEINKISQPDNSQYFQLLTFENTRITQPQVGFSNQKRSMYSNIKNDNNNNMNNRHLKMVQTTPKLNLNCEYIIQGCFYVGSLVSIIYYTDKFLEILYNIMNTDLNRFQQSSLLNNIWSQYANMHAHQYNANNIAMNGSYQHYNGRDLPGEMRSSSTENNNNTVRNTLITDSLIRFQASSMIIINHNNTLNDTIMNNPINKTTDLFQRQIIYTYWSQLINNALWILLIVIQIPFVIRLKRVYQKSLKLSNGFLFIHIIISNLVGWFYVTYISTENYFKHYHEYILTRTKEIDDYSAEKFDRLWILEVNRNPKAYLVNAVAHSHLFIVVLLWVVWNVQKLVNIVLDSGKGSKRHRLVHWEKDNCSLSSSSTSSASQDTKQPAPQLPSSSSPSTKKMHYYSYFKKPYMFGTLSLLSIILLSVHLFSYKLHSYLQILFCYLNYFFILLSTALQTIILSYLLNHDKQLKRILNYPRVLLKNFNWFKTNLLHFLLLFQLTGSVCYNLIQIIEIFLQFTIPAKQNLKFSYPSSTPVSSILPISSILQTRSKMINPHQHHQYNHRYELLFLKYLLISTFCFEMIENFLALLCLPVLMVKCFSYQIMKSKFIIWLLINLITNEICLLIMKIINPQLLILGNDYISHFSTTYSTNHHFHIRSTDTSGVNVGVAMTTPLVNNNNIHDHNIVNPTVNNNHTGFLPNNERVTDMYYSTGIPVMLSVDWWYWIFIKQLSHSLSILFRQSILISCGFIYFN